MACYTQALKLFSQDEKDKEKLKEKGVILKNRAACYLKLVSDDNTSVNLNSQP